MFGFVYIWYDKKHRRYYVGSHQGTFNDRYVCGSSWMKNAYKRRPTDFKRKIISIIYTNRKDLLNEEQKYLNMIKPTELGSRYYNLTRSAWGGSSKGKKHSDETKNKIQASLVKAGWSPERKDSFKDKYTKTLRIRYKDIVFNSKKEAMEFANISRATLDRWCGDNGKDEWSKYRV